MAGSMAVVITIAVCAVVGLFGVLLAVSGVRTNTAYTAEEKQWEQLRATGVRGMGRVLSLSRHPGGMTKGGRFTAAEMSAADLVLAYPDEAGRTHEARIATFIDEALLANFTAGKEVAVVYAREQPARVAIDRERTLLEVPVTGAR